MLDMTPLPGNLRQSGLPPDQQEQIVAATRIVQQGGTVVFPTETVYGLGADATNPAAIQKIYQIKQRPADHPLIVHIATVSHLEYWAHAIPESAWLLAQHFWPGPLTLILQRNRHVPDCVTGGQNTVGLRIPAHPVALALLQALGPEKALAAPSANRFGRISPTSVSHVQQELGDQVDMILDGGTCAVGLESTIVSFHDQTPVVLRPGGVAISSLEAALNEPIALAHTGQHTIRASGSLPAHYAPATPLRLFPAEQIWQQAAALAAQDLRVLVMTWSDISHPSAAGQTIKHFAMPANPIAYGRQLYARLRQFDQAAFDFLLVETPPDNIHWLAVTDRLQRASYHTSNNH